MCLCVCVCELCFKRAMCVFWSQSAVCGCVKTRFATAPWKLLLFCLKLTVHERRKKLFAHFFFFFYLWHIVNLNLSWVYAPFCMLNSTAFSASPNSTLVSRRYHRWYSSPFAKPSLIRFLWCPVRDEWLSLIISYKFLTHLVHLFVLHRECLLIVLCFHPPHLL